MRKKQMQHTETAQVCFKYILWDTLYDICKHNQSTYRRKNAPSEPGEHFRQQG